MQGNNAQHPPAPARRHTVAVIGDSCLDPQQLQEHEIAGDEAYKQRLAEEVGSKAGPLGACHGHLCSARWDE
jgi:hypothetical protein